MASIELIKGSDGSGNASVATVQSTRAALASTIVVDTVVGINPAGFAGSMGTPHTFTDPVTSETITVISEATCVDFTGHVDGSNLEIDTIAPGYTDLGSAIGDIIIIKPTTQYADNLAETLEVAHDDDGSLKAGAVDNVGVFAANVISDPTPFADAMDPVLRASEIMFDHVNSGCVWTADAAGSTRLASCTAGVVYIAGKRLTVAAVNNRTFTASKDVYCDLNDNGDGTAVWVYYDNTTNAASPTLATTGGDLRGAIIVVGASSIAAASSINQGQEDRAVPIASSCAYQVTDSIGNLICPRDPRRVTLGLCQTVNFSTAATSFTYMTGSSRAIKVPVGRKIKVSVSGIQAYNSGTGQMSIGVFAGATLGALTTQLNGSVTFGGNTAAGTYPPVFEVEYTPTTTDLFISLAGMSTASGTSTFTGMRAIIELA